MDSNGVAGRFVWETYSDVNRRLTSLGSGFLRLGLKQGEFVGVYSQNRAEWVIAAEACNAYSMVLFSHSTHIPSQRESSVCVSLSCVSLYQSLLSFCLFPLSLSLSLPLCVCVCLLISCLSFSFSL